jgi:cation diffusion facilitator family transporter
MKIERWGWYSIGVNLLLAALNLVVAAASGSLAVSAEVIHNLVDLVSAFGVLIGIKLANRTSRRFPYGLYKIENVISAVIAILIFMTAYEFARRAVLSESTQVTATPWMLACLALAATIALLFSHFELRAGRRARSPALTADAREYRVHALTTGVAFAAVVAEWLELPVDRVAALLIVAAIVKTGWDLLSESMRVLLDASLDRDTLRRIRDIAGEEPSVVEAPEVRGRNAGRFRFVEIEVVLDIDDFEAADATAHRIEDRIRNEISNVERVLVHADPAPAVRRSE